MWIPWKDWAARRAEAERERRVAEIATEVSASERERAAELARQLRGRHADAVAIEIEKAFRARPPREGGATR